MSYTSIDLARANQHALLVEAEESRLARRATATRRLERRAARLSARAARVSRRAEQAASQARLALARAI